MEITGKLIRILDKESGKSQRGVWEKQSFVIETLETYPKKVCIANWNKKVDLSKLVIGAVLRVSIQIESKEYNNKWFTEIKAWKLDAIKNNEDPENTKNTKTDEPTKDFMGPDDLEMDEEAPF